MFLTCYWDVLRLMDVSRAGGGCFAANVFNHHRHYARHGFLTTVQDVLARRDESLARDESYGLLKAIPHLAVRVVQYAVADVSG